MADFIYEEPFGHGEVTGNPEGSEPVDASALEQELGEARAKALEYLDSWQRAQADYANFKKRLEQDKLDAVKYANSGLVLKILPVLDDFERAGAHVPAEIADAPWVGGIKGIARKLETALESVGVSGIKAQDEYFDPNVHEAVGSVPGPDGMVVQELQRGYMMGERVLRPSRVMVGNGENE